MPEPTTTETPEVFRLKPRPEASGPIIVPVSPFALSEYEKCGERYRLRYIEKIYPPVGPSPAAVRGRALHKGAEHDLRTVQKHLADGAPREEADAPLEEVVQAAVEEFERAERGEDHFEGRDGKVLIFQKEKPAWELFGEKAGTNKDLVAKSMTPLWYSNLAPSVYPAGVETWAETDIERNGIIVRLKARFDVLPANGDLADLKHSKYAFGKWNYATAEEADADDQLTAQDLLYRKITGEKPKTVGFDTVKLYQPRNKDATVAGVIQPRVGPRTDAQIDLFSEKAARIAKGISAGVFVPAQKGKDWWCSAKWCGHWSVCRFGGG